MNVRLQWATPDIDKQILFIARVSNPSGQSSENTNLLKYCMKQGHVSPFEMANVCMEINTTRDIGRQILRHRSFSFQEFSGRYQSYDKLPGAELRECRIQDTENRQNSFQTGDQSLVDWWEQAQVDVSEMARDVYYEALGKGIAKEQARALLPEGLTQSRLYMNGTMRSWIHYLNQRLDPSTQKEHRAIAHGVLEELRVVAPITCTAFFPND
jgi:thymidylate synthase (FAD)